MFINFYALRKASSKENVEITYRILTIYNHFNSVISNLGKEKWWLFPMYLTMQLKTLFR